MTPASAHAWRRRLASAALLLAGVVALLAMGPQFMVFVPILVAAWLLARFGLMPRGVHPRGTAVRIAGGPPAGALRFAEVRIHADARHARDTAELVIALARAISRHAGAEPLALEARASSPKELSPLAPSPERLLDAPGVTLLWLPDAREPARRESDETSQRWWEAWPHALAAQATHRAALALSARWESGEDPGATIGLIGDPSMLGAALTDLARDCRDTRDASAWTSGWVRDVERESARENAARKRRARARDRAS